jgi:chemotaxis protein MotA
MFVIIGYIVIMACVVGGYALAGGHVAGLWQPLELLTIGGAALGAFLVANDTKVMKATLKAVPGVLKGSPYTQAMYMELLSLLYEVLSKVRKEGLMSIESDVEEPGQSALFNKYPLVVEDHHLLEFLTDYLRMMVGGNLNSFEIESLMDNEIETHHIEAGKPIGAVKAMADGLPAFGIVAAVMGVVHTMASVGKPPSELGEMIAHALVGTFLGILLAYGFVTPVASLMESRLGEQAKSYECIKLTLLASINGYAPALSIEFGRKALFSTERPGFKELEDHVKKLKGK